MFRILNGPAKSVLEPKMAEAGFHDRFEVKDLDVYVDGDVWVGTVLDVYAMSIDDIKGTVSAWYAAEQSRREAEED